MGMSAKFSAIEPLNSDHEIENFDCGEPSLNNWLLSRALENMENRVSRTYVTCPATTIKVAGYYALSMAQIMRVEVSGKHRRKMPDQIPCVLIGRLGVDTQAKGQGIGTSLLRDATIRSKLASNEVSARFALVHALNPDAIQFYIRHGFVSLPNRPDALIFDLKFD
jgi:GNAT superfamily N-acetyltransferase